MSVKFSPKISAPAGNPMDEMVPMNTPLTAEEGNVNRVTDFNPQKAITKLTSHFNQQH